MSDKEITDKIITYVRENKFVFYIIIALFFGYTFGKDLALKHNAQDLTKNNFSHSPKGH